MRQLLRRFDGLADAGAFVPGEVVHDVSVAKPSDLNSTV
jgi:hypothetical protein